MKKIVEARFLLNKRDENPSDVLDSSWELVNGGFKAEISKIEMCGVTVPKALLLNLLTERNGELHNVIRFIASLGLTPAAAEHVFYVYITKGLKDCWAILHEFEKNKPTGKARIYKGFGDAVTEIDPQSFTITNGKIGCGIHIDGLWRMDKPQRDAIRGKLKALPFPPNVYLRCAIPLSLSLKHFEQLLTLSGRMLDVACERMWRLSKIQRYLYNPRIERILYAVLFENDVQELKRAEKDAMRRSKRDDVFNELSQPFYFDDGACLVRVGFDVYYVTNNKKAFVLDYPPNVALREAVFRAIHSGKVPTQLREVNDPPEAVKKLWERKS